MKSWHNREKKSMLNEFDNWLIGIHDTHTAHIHTYENWKEINDFKKQKIKKYKKNQQQ